jgi:hypothetical protein
MGAAGFALLWWAMIPVRGNTTCPEPDDVTRALAALLSSAAPDTKESADVGADDDGDGIRLRLLRADGTVLAEKRLLPAPCAELAETAAVVLGVWQAELHPELHLAFDVPERKTAAAPVPAPTANTPPPAAPSPSVDTTPASPPLSVTVASRSRPTEIGGTPWVGTIGVGGLLSFQGSTVAPGLSIEGSARPRDGAWGGALAFSATGEHTEALGPGAAGWRRVAAAAGVVGHADRGRVSLEVGADLVPGLLLVRGSGFTVVRSTTVWDLAAALRARLGVGLGRLQPWVEGGVMGRLRAQAIEATGVMGQAWLPRVGAQVVAGMSVTWLR